VALVGADGPGEVVAAHGLRLRVSDGLGRPDAVIVPGGGWTSRAPARDLAGGPGRRPARTAGRAGAGVPLGSVGVHRGDAARGSRADRWPARDHPSRCGRTGHPPATAAREIQ
jgi:hypothetical protein